MVGEPDFSFPALSKLLPSAAETAAATKNSSALWTSRLRKPKNVAVVGGRQSMHRKPGLANDRNVFQSRIRFDLLERHRSPERFDRNEIDSAPIAFFRGRIRIGRTNNLRDPNYSFVRNAVVKKNFVA